MSQPPFPCPTKKWYNDTYVEIDPKRPELSASDKRVVVTGGGTGIGRAIVKAFAAAGARSIVLLGGRRKELLLQTKKIVEEESPQTSIEILAVDIADAFAVKIAAEQVGEWDVLVLNAAYMPAPAPVLQANLEDQSKALRTNIQGNFHVVHYLVPQKKSNAVVLAVSTGAVSFPANLLGGNALYMSEKFALAKFIEIMSAEVGDCRWIAFHPGVVDTDMLVKSGFKGMVPEDTATLPAHFAVWLSSPEAIFLNGKFAWCNWDVAELKARAHEIESSPIMTCNIVGWPFQ